MNSNGGGVQLPFFLFHNPIILPRGMVVSEYVVTSDTTFPSKQDEIWVGVPNNTRGFMHDAMSYTNYRGRKARSYFLLVITGRIQAENYKRKKGK